MGRTKVEAGRLAANKLKIQRFLDGAAAADGGTISCSAALEDGTVLELGLDARIPRTKAQRQVFVGAAYPTLPSARILARHSPEEEEVIAAIKDYIDRSRGSVRREALPLNKQDGADQMALALMEAILDR